MRAPLFFFSLLAFGYLPLHAEESASKESFSSPAAKEFHEHRSMNRYTLIKSEGIEYVVGNDLWQPSSIPSYLSSRSKYCIHGAMLAE